MEPETNSAAAGPNWKWGIGLLLGSCVLETLIWWGLDPDQTMQMLFSSVLLGTACAALLIWWLAFSRLPWKARRRGLLIAVALFVLIAGIIRIDSYSGAFAPNFAFRWSPTRQQIAEEYWSKQTMDSSSSANEPPRANEHKSPTTGNDRLLESSDDWAEFRGPRRDGIVRDFSLKSKSGQLPDWNTHPPKQRWRHPLGAGMGSFAIVGNRAVTLEQRGQDEAVVCYDFDTGHELWQHRYAAHYVFEVAGEGPRSTPTISRGRVYTLGATGHLCCLELQHGKQLWSHETVSESGASNPIYGTAVSPLIYGNLVIVNPGGPDNQAVVAYHSETGEPAWASGKDQAAYVSPQAATLDGVPQILVYDGIGPKGLQPQVGTELWRYDWSNTAKIHCSQPLVIDDWHILISSGYGRGSVLLKIEQTAAGWRCDDIWKSRDLKMKFNSGVLHAGHVYGIDEGILACIDVQSGKRRWKGGRYGYGQTLLVEDLLLIQAESGAVAIVAASPEAFHEITRFPALSAKTWNIPVICRGRLLVRNESEAACFDLTNPAPAQDSRSSRVDNRNE